MGHARAHASQLRATAADDPRRVEQVLVVAAVAGAVPAHLHQPPAAAERDVRVAAVCAAEGDVGGEHVAKGEEGVARAVGADDCDPGLW